MKNEFIAWDKKKKCFMPSYQVAMNGEGEIYISPGRGYGFYLEVGNRIEILEYSGKKDRNGTKLYKGDIVKAELPMYEYTRITDEALKPKTIIGVVVIRPSEGAILLVKKVVPEDAKGISKGHVLRIKQDRDIRIGHVYTNPELLEEGDIK